MALDGNILNNVFREGGAVGGSLLSSTITNDLNKTLFSRLGPTVGGFLGSQANSILKQLLFTNTGATGKFDPVWKLNRFTVSDANTPPGNLSKSVADDFAGADHPKYKFNYTVSFLYRDTVKNKIATDANTPTDAKATLGSNDMNALSFGLKQVSRPNINVIYQDINFYNYRTKIATKIDFGTITLTFYDDVNSRAHDIVSSYLKTISPISNVTNPYWANSFDAIGVNVNGVSQTDWPDISSVGALQQGEEPGPINAITITHHLPIKYDTTASSTIYDTIYRIVQYTFLNPKIVSINLDDLDSTTSDVSTVGITFTYDAVMIDKVNSNLGTTVLTQGSTQNPNLLTSFLTGLNKTIAPITNAVQSGITSLNNSSGLQQVKGLITF